MKVRQLWTVNGDSFEIVSDVPNALTFTHADAPADAQASAATIAELFGGGTVTAPSLAVAATNLATLNQQADAALASNATYLAIATPTTAQVTAQVKALTKQCNGIIRLLRRRLDATT